MQPTRREFLRLGAVVALSGVLQACGSGAPPGSAPGSLSQASPAATGEPKTNTAASAKPVAVASAATGSSLKVAFGAPVATMALLWVADSSQGFAKRGVNVKLTGVNSAAAIPALLAKDVDVLQLSAAPVITADLNGQADLVFIASGLNHPTFAFYSLPEIHNGAELKGKVVASDKAGTPADYAVGVALSELGLKKSDVSLLPLGSDAAFPALVTGQAQGAILGHPAVFQAEAKGYRRLVDLAKFAYQNVGLIVSKSRLGELAPVLPGLLLAYRDAITTYNVQPELAKKAIQQFTKESDPSILDHTYDFLKTTAPWETSLQPTMEGIKSMIDFLAESVPAAKTAKPEQFVDTRFIAQLPKQ